jgi:hypothetical protein
MDIDDLAERLKDGYYETVQTGDINGAGPASDPEFFKKYARWWDRNGKW